MSKNLYYHLNIDDVFKSLDTSQEGLSKKESAKRLEKYGPNTIRNLHQRSKFWKFLDQFKDLMVIVLIGAAIASFVVSIINRESFIDSIVIIAIVILNAILGFVQEEKANEAVDALSKMQVSLARVRRNGEIEEIPSSEIVPGDIILLEAGDIVPADARLIWETALSADESALTGESMAVEKSTRALKTSTTLSKRTNMVFSGT